jgi:GNAT superfamily N-acetyltransferase
LSALTYRRLNPSLPADVASFLEVFRGTPSFVFPTGGRAPTEAEVFAMMSKVPSGRTSAEVFIHAISAQGVLCGCSVAVRGYPSPQAAYLALLLLVESAQGKSLGPRALRHIESEARSWGCSSILAAVDSHNERALKFWLREGFVEQFRRESQGFMGQAIGIEKNGL